MKTFIAIALLMFIAAPVFAQPDPRDSVILESKTVTPGIRGASDTSAYLYVRVYITNKDSLVSLMLVLQETSTSGGAYAILGRPRSFTGVVTPLVPSLRYGSAVGSVWYNSSSPDSFVVVAGFEPTNPLSIEPPNSVRKAVWELKFDSVLSNAGTFELDTVRTSQGSYTAFTNTEPRDVPVNFVKSVITVANYPKGDLNQDVALSPADVVWILNCVMLGTPPPGGVSSCDLNCDGQNSPADVVLELNAVFGAAAFPC